MLERAGRDAAKPEELAAHYGLNDDGDYFLSPEQAQAILEMRLNRLTALEQENLLTEYRDVVETIADLLEILGSEDRLMSIIQSELVDIRDEYGDVRRTTEAGGVVRLRSPRTDEGGLRMHLSCGLLKWSFTRFTKSRRPYLGVPMRRRS